MKNSTAIRPVTDTQTLSLTKHLARSRAAMLACNRIQRLQQEFRKNDARTVIAMLSNLRSRRVEALTEVQVRTLLFRLNRSVELQQFQSDQLTLALPARLTVPELPQHYAYKGGAARFALLRSLFPDKGIRKPRDLDLVRFVRSIESTDKQLAAQLMPEDYAHGFGVEHVPTAAQYFSSRDLTINEVYLMGNKVVCSHQCLVDVLSSKLRLSQHTLSLQEALQIRPALKALRLQAELRIQGFECITELPTNYSVEDIQPRALLREIRRALSRGSKVAELFFRELKARKLTPTGIQSIGDLIAALERDSSASKNSPHTSLNRRSRVFSARGNNF